MSALKTLEGELTAVSDNGSFEMYALVFGNVDRQGDLIEPQAVTNVDELVKDGWIALNHDQTAKPIAWIDSASQDAHGLKLAGKFHSHPDAQDVRSYVTERLKAGKGVKTSIGYKVPADGQYYVRAGGMTVNHITKLAVYEASFVNLPANPEAEVLTAKSLDGPSTVESEEEMSAAAVLKEVKRALGLLSKSEYKVGGEDMERMKGLIDKCAVANKSMEAHHKSLKSSMDDHATATDEMVKCFKNFTAGQQQDKEPDNEGNDADKDEPEETEEGDDEEEEKPKGKARKAPKSKDDDEESQEEKALKAYQIELKRRALGLKYPSRAS